MKCYLSEIGIFNCNFAQFKIFYLNALELDFEKNNEIQISYRLSPFVSLENLTG